VHHTSWTFSVLEFSRDSIDIEVLGELNRAVIAIPYNIDLKELVYVITSHYFILAYKAGLDIPLFFFKLLIIYRENIINIEEYSHLAVMENTGILGSNYKA
jgi:hypothetical protein